MDDQEKKQSFIESFEDEGSGVWLPHGPVVIQQPLASPLRSDHSEKPAPVQATTTNETVLEAPEKTAQVSDNLSTTYESSSGNSMDYTDLRNDTEKCEEISDLGYSRTSHISAIDHERHVTDKFNGILYHVIPTYNQIAVMFSTKGLYSQFIASLEKELHSKSPNKQKPRYETHLNGQKCIISCDQSESSIAVTGPGRCLWRESTFLQMSLRLFSYFAAENLEENSVVHEREGLTSTPADQWRHKTHTNILMSPIPMSEPIQNMNYEELNKQVNTLSEVVKTLQGQMNKIQDFMSQLSKNVDNQKQCSDTTKASEQEESVILLPGTEVGAKTLQNLFKENEPPVFPGTSSYSAATASNIEKRRNNVVNQQQTNTNRNRSKNSQNNQPELVNKVSEKPIKPVINRRPTSSKTRLIGDSILSGINKKGLNRNVECQSVSGATVDTLIDKIQIYDLKCFDNIVIYVAGNDCADMNSDSGDFEIIEEKYDQLLNQIKQKNADINLYLCSLCPRVDTLVKDVNDMIKRLCADHQGTFIDVHKAFYNKRNQLKVHFYQQRDNIHLAASGTRGLLGAINSHIDIVENFKTCALNHLRGSSQYQSYQHEKKQYRLNQSPNDNNVERCFKCGLTNHKTHQCFHEKQVQCFLCKYYGHKDSICSNQ